MNLDAASLLEQAGRYAHLLESDGASVPSFRAASDQQVLRGIAEAARLVRLAEAALAMLAGEVAPQ